METKNYDITLLTDLLCHGANKNAEIRIPSIRGHLRKWHTILLGEDDMKKCWGGVEQDNKEKKETSISSKVVLRLFMSSNVSSKPVNMLPHKTQQVMIQGINAEQNFSIRVSYRYCSGAEFEKIKAHVEKTIEIWLLLGTFGQRGTRAFGSVWDKSTQFNSPKEYIEKIQSILSAANSTYAVQVLKPQKDADKIKELMKCCTDTLNGRPDLLGGIKPRQVSPLKMKIIKISNQYYLVLHAKNHKIIDDAIEYLSSKPKPISQKFTITASNRQSKI